MNIIGFNSKRGGKLHKQTFGLVAINERLIIHTNESVVHIVFSNKINIAVEIIRNTK